jgi:protein-disulfide isomerase
MSLFSRYAILTAVATATLPTVSAIAADAPAAGAADKAAIEAVVHDYLMAHPEVIIEAVQNYQEKLESEKDSAAKLALIERTPQLLNDPDSQVLGNAQSDCVIVEFFDNQCPYCQANEPELQKLLKQDARVKLVLKEFPILGPISVTAAKAALASVKQGKYPQFHEALLAHKGHYDKAALVDEIAKSVGLDLDKLHKDMESPEIAAELAKNIDLGKALNITGTPGFVIGDQIVPGAANMDELKKYVANACAKKG